LGLKELQRVVKPGGQIILLDHVRSEKAILGKLMDALNPLVVRMTGANINRRTVENVRKAGLQIENVEDLGMGDIIKLTLAHTE
jgi:ubiquinone/menaquinone biosynthesis C-methylase UbiE